jgi:hypothetical protein
LRQRLDQNESGPIDGSSLYKIAHITLLICVFAQQNQGDCPTHIGRIGREEPSR